MKTPGSSESQKRSSAECQRAWIRRAVTVARGSAICLPSPGGYDIESGAPSEVTTIASALAVSKRHSSGGDHTSLSVWVRGDRRIDVG